MPTILASEVIVDDRIILDMGATSPMDETCTVTEVTSAHNLFKQPVIRFKVRRPGGTIVDVVDHKPADKVDIEDRPVVVSLTRKPFDPSKVSTAQLPRGVS